MRSDLSGLAQWRQAQADIAEMRNVERIFPNVRTRRGIHAGIFWTKEKALEFERLAIAEGDLLRLV